MKLLSMLSFVIVFQLLCSPQQGTAQTQMSTGFYYPVQPNSGYTTGYHMLAGMLPVSASYGGHFMSPSNQRVDPQTSKAGAYLKDLYHDGYDVLASHGSPVYAIAGGVVQTLDYGTSWNCGGTNNMAVILVHTTATGQQFRAIYGHLEVATLNSQLKTGVWISAGTMIAKVGTYCGGDHLHFGVNMLDVKLPLPFHAAASVADVIGWGRIGINHWPQGSWPDRQAWVDPVFFLETNSPNASVNTNDLAAQSDMKQYLVAKVDSSLIPNAFGFLRQDQYYEYRYQWFYKNVSGQIHWFIANHATFLYDRSVRYVSYENWDNQKWTNWFQIVVFP